MCNYRVSALKAALPTIQEVERTLLVIQKSTSTITALDFFSASMCDLEEATLPPPSPQTPIF